MFPVVCACLAAAAVGFFLGRRSRRPQSPARLQALLDASHRVGIVATDPAGLVTLFNTGAERLLGYSADEVLRRHTPLAWHLELDLAQRAAERHVSGLELLVENARRGSFDEQEWTYVRKDGTTRRVASCVTAIKEHGRLSGFLGIFLDITELRESVAKLEESERRFKEMADHVPVMVWMAGPDKGCTYFNRQWLEFTGRPPEAQVGRGWAESIHPDDLFHVWGTYKQKFDSRESYQMEYRLRRHDGQYRWMLDYGVPRYGAEGEFFGYIGCCLDFTDRKQTRDRLKETQSRLEFALGSGQIGLWEWDVDADEITVSPDWLGQFGESPEAGSLPYDYWLRRVHPDDREAATGLIRDYLEGRAASYRTTFRLKHKDGRYRWILSRGELHQDADGGPGRMVGVHIDITERRENELHLEKLNAALEDRVRRRTRELREANARLEDRVGRRTRDLIARNQELDQFAYVASHDLKSPLRGIDHLVTFLEEDLAGSLPEESARHLSQLRQRVRRMERLLEDLLEYSRAGRTRGEVGEVAVASLVRETLGLLPVPAGFHVTVETEVAALETARTPLAQCLRNLIDNALKHRDRDDGRVRVSCRDAGEWLEFAVDDDGPGIPAEAHGQIFQMFKQLRPRDQVEGSGIGLAVVKRIVEGFGGRVSVESEPGRGATFSFTWPKRLPRED